MLGLLPASLAAAGSAAAMLDAPAAGAGTAASDITQSLSRKPIGLLTAPAAASCA
jgi:hypothetical protein